MKTLLRKIFLALTLALFLVSCGTTETMQPLPTEEKQSLPSVFPSSTALPTITSTAIPLVTPRPTTSAEATIAAFQFLCSGSKEIPLSEISPNGKWIAALCYNENGKEASPLQVVSIDHSHEWKIYYRDYVRGDLTGDRHDGIMPYRRSKDGRFLYAVAGSRESGCCWIGGKYVLLVRLNLETGLIEELLNTIDPTTTLRNSFTISENDRYLLFTPVTEQSYDFAVLDLFSGKTRVVKLEEPKYIDLEFASMSPYEDIIVLPYLKNIEFNDYVVVSLALINLSNNQQRILVSDLKEGEELFPIRWIDKKHVLISNANPYANRYFFDPPIEYWSLSINTGERKIVDNP